MKASETRLVDFLRKSNQFLIPIFQRPYSWRPAQCRQFWDDILRISTTPSAGGHFLGSVVYVEQGLYTATSLPRLLVIDGQQRLTTTLLLLDALGRHIGATDGSDLTRQKLQTRYLFNSGEDGEQRFKLLLAEADRETLCRLLEDKPLPDRVSHTIPRNRDLFAQWISESGLPAAKIHDGIAKLLIVDIALDRNHDNPQLIFESLNSTGLDLSQSDLIRNHVLLGIEPKEQGRLYETYWQPVERMFLAEGREKHFDRFMRDYLTLKTGEVPKVEDVYKAFKTHRNSDAASVEPLMADVLTFAKHYGQIAFGSGKDVELNRHLADLRALRMEVANPFLMEVFEDHRLGRLDRAGLLQVLQILESYLFRRAVCDIPSNVLSRAFATLAKGIDPTNYVQSFAAILLTRDRRSRFPLDAEFEPMLHTRDLYNLRNRDYCLRKLENHNRKEPVRLEDFTIEHILPQNKNLSPEWQLAVGPDWQTVRSRWLHTLGNLTLTGYNSELSDRPFAEKKNMVGGFADSPIRLSRDLAKLSTWNEAHIAERGRQLAKRALEIWPTPEVPPELLEKHRATRARPTGDGPACELTDVRRLTGQTLALFVALRDALRAACPDLKVFLFPTLIGLGLESRSRPYFCIIGAQKSALRMRLRLPFASVQNPPEWCTRRPSKSASGDRVRLHLRSVDHVPTAVDLLCKAAERMRKSGVGSETAEGDR